MGHADAFQPYTYSLWPFSMVGVETPPPPVNAYSDPPACIELKKVQMYLSLPEWMEWSKWKGQDGSWVFSVLSNWCKESKLLMRSKLKLLVKSKKILIKKIGQKYKFSMYSISTIYQSECMFIANKMSVNLRKFVFIN